MTDEIKEAPKKLTLEDPIDSETLKKLSELRETRLQIADRLVDLEIERVRMMVAVRQIDGEKNRLFEKTLVDRGLPPGFPVNVDGQTGKIHPLAAPSDQQAPAPVTPPTAPQA